MLEVSEDGKTFTLKLTRDAAALFPAIMEKLQGPASAGLALHELHAVGQAILKEFAPR